MRNRLYLVIALAATIALGLATRSPSLPWPAFATDHFGDALWAVAAYLGVCLLVPKLAPHWVALAALAISFGVEFSQLLTFDWLESIRATRLGRLLLGWGFLWVDLVRYSAGVLCAWLIDAALTVRNRG